MHAADGVGAAVRALAGELEWSQVQRSALLLAAEHGGRGVSKGDLNKGEESESRVCVCTCIHVCVCVLERVGCLLYA